MLNFDFSKRVWEKLLCSDFSRIMFLMLYPINRPNFIVWYLLPLEILGNMCIALVCFPDCDVIKFEIYFIFRIKPIFYRTKKAEIKI